MNATLSALEGPVDPITPSHEGEDTAIFDTAGLKLGTITDGIIDTYSGEVPYAVLEFGSSLGMRTGGYAIPWSVLRHQGSAG